jgi:capsule polysaccharide export protein KpsE/RkpR
MSINHISDRSKRKRLRHAERKLLQAQKRLVRAQRSVASWTQKVADLRYEGLRAVQRLFWPEEDAKPEP